jgi:hypothetical protein
MIVATRPRNHPTKPPVGSVFVACGSDLTYEEIWLVVSRETTLSADCVTGEITFHKTPTCIQWHRSWKAIAPAGWEVSHVERRKDDHVDWIFRPIG